MHSAQNMPHKANAQQQPMLVIPLLCVEGPHTPYTSLGNLDLCHRPMPCHGKRKPVYFNCLKLGHLKLQCPSSQRCHQCQRPYHTLLHQDNDGNTPLTTTGRRSPPRSHSSPRHNIKTINPALACLRSSRTPKSCTHYLPGIDHDSREYYNASKSIA